MKRLFLLDSFALIYRSYYAFIKNPRINSKGFDTSASLGFTNSLLDIIKKERPTHLGAAFDLPATTEREVLYSDYKANREAMPEPIRDNLPYITDILDAFGIPILKKEGYEADDVIGTMVKKAEREGFESYMVTPDKDFAQLVSEHTFLYRLSRFSNAPQVMGIPEVLEKFKLQNVSQMIDFLGMMGDAVDNIPGLPGVGEKTAQKLLATYGSMEATFEHAHEIKGKLGEKIRDNMELGIKSKMLATIITDVDIEFEAERLTVSPPDMDRLRMIFDELEFKRLSAQVEKVYGIADTPQLFTTQAETNVEISSENETTSINNYDHFYQCVDTPYALHLLCQNLLNQPVVCFDTETSALEIEDADLIGIAFSYQERKGYYVPLTSETIEETLEVLRPFFYNETIVKVGHNLKFDIRMIQKYGVEVRGPYFDTMIAHYLIAPDMRHKMDDLAKNYLSYEPIPIESLIGKKGKQQASMETVSLDQQTEYAVEDAEVTLRLKKVLEEKMKEDGLLDLYYEIEIPLMEVLASMESTGVRISPQILKKQADSATDGLSGLEQKIYSHAGENFLISSPKQLGTILFEKLKLVEKPQKTKTGQYATSEDILTKLSDKHEIIQNILDYRTLQKLKSTYLDALPTYIDANTRRVHTTFGQTIAATGRLSSNHPNLQNIPIRTPEGRQVREAFIPTSDDYTLVSADYSQIELRLIAAMSEDQAMISAFQNNEDIHAITAARVFKIPLTEVTRELRSYAKIVNFGIIYGVSAFGLSRQSNLSRKEAAEMIENYFLSYPRLRTFMDDQVSFCKENGYVETLLKRRRYLPEIRSSNASRRAAAERIAVNAPIQGSAADIIKIAMIRFQKEARSRNFKSKMTLQVHDELVIDTHKDELDEVKKLLVSCMENAYSLPVPLTVDIGEGENWLQAH